MRARRHGGTLVDAKEVESMATISPEQPDAATDRPTQRGRLVVPEMWAALAISVIWLVVLVAALFGPDLVSSNAGASFTRIPSAIILGFFAWLATWVIARHGFAPHDDES
jgi:hypothetical protein